MRLHLVKIGLFDCLADDDNPAVRNGLIKITPQDICEAVSLFDLLQNNGGQFGVQLCAVRAIYFLAVVFCRVMAGGDSNTGSRPQMPHGK